MFIAIFSADKLVIRCLQIYLYERNSRCDGVIAERPRQCCPLAYVKFVSKQCCVPPVLSAFRSSQPPTINAVPGCQRPELRPTSTYFAGRSLPRSGHPHLGAAPRDVSTTARDQAVYNTAAFGGRTSMPCARFQTSGDVRVPSSSFVGPARRPPPPLRHCRAGVGRGPRPVNAGPPAFRPPAAVPDTRNYSLFQANPNTVVDGRPLVINQTTVPQCPVNTGPSAFRSPCPSAAVPNVQNASMLQQNPILEWLTSVDGGVDTVPNRTATSSSMGATSLSVVGPYQVAVTRCFANSGPSAFLSSYPSAADTGAQYSSQRQTNPITAAIFAETAPNWTATSSAVGAPSVVGGRPPVLHQPAAAQCSIGTGLPLFRPSAAVPDTEFTSPLQESSVTAARGVDAVPDRALAVDGIPAFFQEPAAAAFSRRCAAETVASTSPAVSPGASTERDSLLQHHRHLVAVMLRQCVAVVHVAVETMKVAQKLPCIATQPWFVDAWSRLLRICLLQRQVYDRVRFYAELCQRLGRSVDAATLKRSCYCVDACRQRMNAIYCHWCRWELVAGVRGGHISNAALAKRGAGMSADILQFSDELMTLLTAFQTTLALTLPSVDPPAAQPPPPADTAAVQGRRSSAAIRFRPEDYDPFRLAPGGLSDQHQISERLAQEVDRLLASTASPPAGAVLQLTAEYEDGLPGPYDQSPQPPCSNTLEAELEEPAFPLFVIAPDDLGGSDTPPPSEIKFAATLSADSRRRRVRRTDLGTIDLDPVDDDGAILPPDAETFSCALPTAAEDVIVAPAINVASGNNLGLDLFVQLMLQPSALTEEGDNSSDTGLESRPISTSEAVTVRRPASDVKLVKSWRCDDEQMSELSVTPSYSDGCYGDVKTIEDAAVDSDVDVDAEPDVEPRDAKPHPVLRPSPVDVGDVINSVDDCLRFSLPPSFYELAATSRQPEADRIEAPERRRQPSDVDNSGDSGGAVLMDRDPAAPASKSAFESEDGLFCQIANVYSLSREEADAMDIGVPDPTDDGPATCYAPPGPGEVSAAKTADASCQTASNEEEASSSRGG